MSNEFYTATAIVRHSQGRSSGVNSELSAVEAGFDKIPTEVQLKRGTAHLAVDSGAINAYVLTPVQPVTAYNAGDRYSFIVGVTNDGPSTVNVYDADGVLLGVKQICNFAGDALTGGELMGGALAEIWNDATNGYFRIVNPLIAVASVTSFNINGMTTGTVVDPAADYVPIYDASAGAQRKVLASQIADEANLVLASQVFGRR